MGIVLFIFSHNLLLAIKDKRHVLWLAFVVYVNSIQRASR